MHTRHALRWVLALTSLASFMAALDTLVVVTARPVIQRGLGAGLSTLQWVDTPRGGNPVYPRSNAVR